MKNLLSKLIVAIAVLFGAVFNSYAQPTITTVAGGNTRNGFAGDGYAATDTIVRFRNLAGVVLDSAGNIFIADAGNYRIRKVNAVTGIITTIGGNGTNGYSGDGGPAVAAKMGNVSSLSVDRSGNCYFFDVDNRRIRRIDYSSGIITTVAGNGVDSSYGDGGAATGAGIKPESSRGLFVDAAGDVYFGDGARIRKVNYSTGIISTICGNGTSGYSGDGGAAIAATISFTSSITGDGTGNLYFLDVSNGRLRKIDASGNISTVAGGGTINSTGCPATACTLSLNSNSSLGIDSAYNIYLLAHGGLFKITASTGIINALNLASINIGMIFVNRTGAIFGIYDNGYSLVNKVVGASSVINTWSVRDTLLSAPCTLPRKIGIIVSGTINGTPSASDSVDILVDFWYSTPFAYDSSRRYRIPYSYASGSYTFGSTTSILDSFIYTFPGEYIPIVTATTLRGNTDTYYLPNDTAQVGCSASTIALVPHGVVSNNLITAPCVFPMVVQYSGAVTFDTTMGTRPSPTDSVYVFMYFGDLAVAFAHIGFDSSGVARYTVNYGYPSGSGPAGIRMSFVNSSGFGIVNYVWPDFSVYDCSHGGYISHNLYASSSFSCGFPDTVNYQFGGQVFDSATTATNVIIHVNYGDGSTDSTIVPIILDESHLYRALGSFSHVFTSPGVYTSSYTCSAAGTVASGMITYDGLSEHTVGTSCIPLTGYFYLDSNANCTRDSYERTLAYWPYAIINTTLGDTTYGFCNDSGKYIVSAVAGYNYAVVADPSGAFFHMGTTGSTLMPSCPSSGIYTFTATAGVSLANDFAFTCNTPTTMDMSVSSFGAGFVPGDTGTITIWSSNPWGYMCDTLSATVSCVIDSRLSYIGMWSGPAPTSISGDTLKWRFATLGNLFDFHGQIKVRTDTAATIYDTIHIASFVSATRIADPNMANNSSSFQLAVASSWDPNDKQVSPQGFSAQGYIPNGTPLSYMVRFQNTGTARARNITVIDTLSADLDISTLQIISSSAPVLVYNFPGNIVKFRFNDINLPDSTTDLEGSNGYISYNIVPKDNLAANTRITNSASIYFDYNPGVLTNATINTIEDTIGALYGANSVCAGSTITLTNHIPDGVWSSSNGHATVSSTGIVTGVSAGVDTISYTVYGDQTVTKIITINPLPATGTITGTTVVCVGAATALTDTITGGSWSSASATIASVSVTGVVTGVSTGSTTISYSLTNSCGTAEATTTLTVNPLPVAGTLSGSTTVCEAATTTLTPSISGGTWTTSSATTASVSGGVVSGIAAGSATISYSMTNSCGTDVATAAITVNPLPHAGTLSGTTTICEASTTTFTSSITGGTWTTSAATTASVSGGVVSGISAGSATISYSMTNSCGTDVATAAITVNPLPHAGTLSGTTTVCEAATTTLTPSITGGTWTTSAATTASVSGGVVSGITAGSAIISYSMTNSCGTDIATAAITVNPLPHAGTLSGTTTVCEAATTTLTPSITSGMWTTSSATTASVSGGVVSGIAAGSATISYSMTNSCGTDIATAAITVNPLPHAGTLSGTTTVCEAATTTLTSSISGGTWTTSAATTASVSGGVVSGIAAGSATISYIMTNSCGTDIATAAITVNPLPVAGTITGADSVCMGSAITLSSSGSSGTTSTWTLTNTAATISGTVVTGAYAGTDTAIHTSANSCGTVSATRTITIMPIPDPGTLSGADSVCAGASITLSSTVTGGAWSITGTSATVSAGVVTGVAAGTSSVTYSVTNYCGTGIRVHPVITNPLPVAGTVSGSSTVCESTSTLLASTEAGGTWSSSATSTASVDAATGVVTGITAGSVNISYTVTNSCGSDAVAYAVTVDPLPLAGAITGSDSVCITDTIVLANATATGTAAWSSSNTAIANVTASGEVIGVSSGSVTISYTATNSCGTANTTRSVYVKSIADCNTSVAQTHQAISSPQVYPNPNSGQFIVELPGNCTNATIAVTDVSGKVITTMQPKNASGLKVPVDLSNFATGTYLLNMNIDGKHYHDKVVVW